MYGGCALTYAGFLDKLIAQECDGDLRLREQSLMVRLCGLPLTSLVLFEISLFFKVSLYIIGNMFYFMNSI